MLRESASPSLHHVRRSRGPEPVGRFPFRDRRLPRAPMPGACRAGREHRGRPPEQARPGRRPLVKTCKACGTKARKLHRALVMGPDREVASGLVCGPCEDRGIVIVALCVPVLVKRVERSSDDVERALRVCARSARHAPTTAGPEGARPSDPGAHPGTSMNRKPLDPYEDTLATAGPRSIRRWAD